MAYRDEHDPRIGHLQKRVDSEPQLLLDRRRIRAEHDRLQERADELGLRIGEAERAWFGGDDERAPLAREHEQLLAALAILVEQECAIDRELAGLADARVELAALKAAAVRAMAGPPGQQLRALERELARVDAALGALDPAVTLAERAESESIALCKMQETERERSLVGNGVTSASSTSLEEQLDTTVALLRELVNAIETLREIDRWREDTALSRLLEQLKTHDLAWIVRDARQLYRLVTTAVSRLGGYLLPLQQQRARLVAECSAVVDSAL